jgi:hypothetical protein
LLDEEKLWLDALKPALAAQNPPSPTAMLELRSTRSAVEARSIDAQADRISTEFQLAEVAGLAVDQGLPQPMSIPFAGHFLPSKGSGITTWTARQSEIEIPRWEIVINDHATALSEAGAARTAATANFVSGRAEIDGALAAIEMQTTESAAFLDALTSYNRMIAKSVTSDRAPIASVESLAAALRIAP